MQEFYFLGVGLGSALAVIAALLTAAAAALAMLGPATENKRLTKVGASQFGVVALAAVIAIAQVILTSSKENSEALAQLTAQNLVLQRVDTSIESLKKHLLCMPPSSFDRTPVLSSDELIQRFINKPCSEAHQFSASSADAFVDAAAALDEFASIHSGTLSAKMKDDMAHFSRRSGLPELVEALRAYSPVEERSGDISFGDFSDYLVQSEYGQNRLQHVFLALTALEKHVLVELEETSRRRNHLLPTCTDPLQTDCVR
ncbi:hypothetical protein [Desulfonatronovibrio hydrogenovorans]|uniref:hypothetical protein n=1 Tax=Desulfonatronovibrio hydrogenovorans TaxID=53245 RepID=UPI00048D706F|nr:hypothetical protein [Desulfonatronovibrio hydrogenovorans]